MDKISEMNMLLDFYGGLLTERQRYVMDCHYQEDLSLSEISEELNVSRQAAYDIIKRSEKILTGYEKELGLLKRFMSQKQKLTEIRRLLVKHEDDEDIRTVINMIDDLLQA